MMTVSENPQFAEHEHVSFFHDANSGLKAIVAVHRRGKKFAVGGTRMKRYSCTIDALDDALRLSKAMTYKLALANIPLGGGKSVIIADPQTDKTLALMAMFGRYINRLGGSYCCAPDVGTTPDDMQIIRNTTPHVRGLRDETGDSSIDTAIGVFHAIRAAVKHKFARDRLDNVKVAIQGVGNVGRYLYDLLHRENVLLTIADPNINQLNNLRNNTNTTVVNDGDILQQDVDIIAPCALGNVITEELIMTMQAKIICGAANNQLCNDNIPSLLSNRGILYVPDYVANAGGVIGGCRMDCDYSAMQAQAKIADIYGTCLEIFKLADSTGQTTPQVANSIAEHRMNVLL